MKEHRIGRILATIDEIETRKLYDALLPVEGTDSATRNFLKNCRQRQASLNKYFEPLGIDPIKCQEFWSGDVDPFCQTVTYNGIFPIVGTPQNPDQKELHDIYACSDEETEFGFQLNYFILDGKLIIDMGVVFPWLFEPPIIIPRYINKTVLPEIEE